MTEREYEIITARAEVDMMQSLVMGFDPPPDMIAIADVNLVRGMVNAWRERLYADELVDA